MKSFLIALACLLGGQASPVFASSPCGPDTWFSNPKRSAKDWEAMPLAKVIFIGKLKSRKENLMPFANCYAADRSQCEIDDQSEVSVEVLKIEKGGPEKFPVMSLKKSYCAPPPPKAIGEVFRFYAYPSDLKPNSSENKFSYLYFEPAQAKK